MLVLIGSCSGTAASGHQVLASETYTLINSTNLAKPGCPSRCGDVIVPYPFGIGNNTNCSIGHGFNVYCNQTSDPPRATLREEAYTSLKLISDSTLRTTNKVSSRCYLPNGTVSTSFQISLGYADLPYTFSEVNKFIVIGCDDYAWLTSGTQSRNISTGCMVFCSTPEDVVGDQCSGNGCCQSAIPHDIKYYGTQLRTLQNSDDMNNTRTFNPCTYAFVGEENAFKFNGAADLKDTSLSETIEPSVPIVLEWAIGNLSCSDAKAIDGFACQSNSKCVDSKRESGGYRCICSEGYEGNPYLYPGCQDIKECDDKSNISCYGRCSNTEGGYKCTCFPGYIGDATIPEGCQPAPKDSKFPVMVFTLGKPLLG
ncbi:EGF-like calcium-binding [Cynara cardunculus var. scolymus]|uniref:EGF-like calcium-binding n=1 Tax=Cynara cardunculus var. scolymus TaxID=59895 RepID=A0A124SCT5_CYNCS|nr:EGF-like calcium-binding [Cynara cardunculus var. scolymus]